jgi:hypothetical protein
LLFHNLKFFVDVISTHALRICCSQNSLRPNKI